MSSTNSINSFGNVHMVKYTPTFEWTINNFCICHKKSSEKIKSPIFSMGNNDDLKWRIHLYPKGFDKNYAEYVSLFLQLEFSEHGDVKTNYKFSIVNNKNMKTNEMGSDNDRLFTPGCDWGFREYISRSVLFDEKNGLLPDNKLTIYCEIDVNKNNNNNLTESIAMPIQLSDNQMKVLNDLEALLKKRNFCDVTIVGSDKKFYAHKAILAARSSVFSQIFEQCMLEKRQNVIEINELDQKLIKELLHYVYTGKVEDLKNVADSLLPVADKYALEGLKTICEDSISKTLNVDNAAEILSMADQYNASRLKKETLNFIIYNGENVTNTEGFKTIIAAQPHLIAEAFQTMIAKWNPSDESEIPKKKRKHSSDSGSKEK